MKGVKKCPTIRPVHFAEPRLTRARFAIAAKRKKAKENEQQEHDEANFKRNDYILENG